MKNLILTIIALFSIALVWGQEDFVPKFDGTKYYMLIYDGENNEKVLSYHSNKGWNEAVGYSDFFDGSSNQLWVFEEPSEHSGYINVRNLDESLTNKHFLKSWSWNAYLEPQTGAREGDQEKDLELVFRFKHIFDGWQALETIEKPAGLYGVEYTPEPDALNIGSNGVASFNNVKTSSIKQENAAMKVFKLVEFDPIALFADAIERGQDLYDANQDLPAAVLEEFFYTLEKAREKRVFGTDAQMLEYQAILDSAITGFLTFTGLTEEIENAKAFIDTSEIEESVKTSFRAIITRIEDYMNGSEIDYTQIEKFKTDLLSASNLVDAMVAAEVVQDTLAKMDDTRFAAGMGVAISDAKSVLAAPDSTASAFNNCISILGKMEEFLNEIKSAQELVDNTAEFEEAKQILTAKIDEALTTANSPGITLEELNAAIKQIQADVKAFKKALEAGDTMITLVNPGFEDNFTNWTSESDNPGIPYTQNDGVDKSVNMAYWHSADYHVKTYQYIAKIPNGKYEVSMMAVVSEGGKISLFAQSGGNMAEDTLAFEEWSYTKRAVVIEVTDSTLAFGVKGTAPDNLIPANIWGTFDNFEIKWLSSIEIQNPGFESEFDGWTSTSDNPGIPYTQNDGVDKTKNMAVWHSADYHVSTSQTISVPNGVYQISVWAKISADNHIALFAKSGDSTYVTVFQAGASAYAKSSVEVVVNNDSLTFGIKGNGVDNLIPANVWGTFDNFEVMRLPNIHLVNPGFENDFEGWTKDSDTDWMPYIELKGVEKSKSVTYWQGIDYHVSTYQDINNLFNGEYEISAMTYTPNDSSYLLFGESGGIQNSLVILSSTDLVKNKKIANVTDNTLRIGVRGSGMNNMVPANHWIVFDNFDVTIKSITPVYLTEPLDKKQYIISDVEQINEELDLIWWQENDMLMISSKTTIESMAIYMVTGVKLVDIRPYTNIVSVPLKKGIYFIHVITEKNISNSKKVMIK